MQMAMWRMSVAAWAMAVSAACALRTLPSAPLPVPLEAGRYVKERYVAPGFTTGNLACELGPFTYSGPPDNLGAVFLPLFTEEWQRVWQAQGLKPGPEASPCRLTGTIDHLAVRGTRLRWFAGRLHGELVLSGTLTREDQVLFAFRDRIRAFSPLAPGPAAPKEQELLLRFLAREAVTRLVNELLLTPEQVCPD